MEDKNISDMIVSDLTVALKDARSHLSIEDYAEMMKKVLNVEEVNDLIEQLQG